MFLESKENHLRFFLEWILNFFNISCQQKTYPRMENSGYHSGIF